MCFVWTLRICRKSHCSHFITGKRTWCEIPKVLSIIFAHSARFHSVKNQLEIQFFVAFRNCQLCLVRKIWVCPFLCTAMGQMELLLDVSTYIYSIFNIIIIYIYNDSRQVFVIAREKPYSTFLCENASVSYCSFEMFAGCSVP